MASVSETAPVSLPRPWRSGVMTGGPEEHVVEARFANGQRRWEQLLHVELTENAHERPRSVAGRNPDRRALALRRDPAEAGEHRLRAGRVGFVAHAELDHRVSKLRLELGGRSPCEDPAVVVDPDAGGQAVGPLEVLRGEQ